MNEHMHSYEWSVMQDYFYCTYPGCSSTMSNLPVPDKAYLIGWGDALDEACKAVCVLCAEDAPIVGQHSDNYWHDTGGTPDLCDAPEIRRLMEEVADE